MQANYLVNVLKSFKTWVVFLFVVLVILLIKNHFSKVSDAEQETFPVVTATKAEFGAVTHYIDAIGTIKASDSVDMKAEIAAKVAKVYFSEGSKVKAGDLLLELDNKEALADLMENEAQYRRAVSEFEPIKQLANRGVAARIERDKKQAEMESYAARVESRKAVLSKYSIRAPFDGVVGLKSVSVGQYVSPGASLLKVVSMHSLKIDFKVAEDQIGNVYVGQMIEVFLGGDTTQPYTAKVAAIDPETEDTSHTFVVRAVLDVPDVSVDQLHGLRPGRFATVRVALDSDERGILIPESSIEGNAENKTVYIIKEGLAIRTPVTTGVRKDGNIEILTGVDDGDIVITNGQSGVIDGKPVEIQKEITSAEIAGVLKQRYASKKRPGR